ncbi:MAG: hypothetical protein ACP5N3_06360 [Candidatus Nanoarchaeia archaeon]
MILQKTLDLVAEQTDSAFAEKKTKGDKIFGCDTAALKTTWKGHKAITIDNKAYLTEYNYNEDSLEVYVSEYLAAQRSYNRFTAAIDEILELKPALSSSTRPDQKYIK